MALPGVIDLTEHRDFRNPDTITITTKSKIPWARDFNKEFLIKYNSFNNSEIYFNISNTTVYSNSSSSRWMNDINTTIYNFDTGQDYWITTDSNNSIFNYNFSQDIIDSDVINEKYQNYTESEVKKLFGYKPKEKRIKALDWCPQCYHRKTIKLFGKCMKCLRKQYQKNADISGKKERNFIYDFDNSIPWYNGFIDHSNSELSTWYPVIRSDDERKITTMRKIPWFSKMRHFQIEDYIKILYDETNDDILRYL